MLPDVRAQPLGAVPAQDEPELQRAEPAPERDLPVAEVDDGAGVGRGVAQVLRKDRQGAGEGGPVGDPEEGRVEAGEQPLVRVGGVAVGPLDAGLQLPQLGDDGADPRIGGVHVQPDAVLLADRAELGQRVDRRRRRRPHRRADQDRRVAAGDVALEPCGERGRAHGEVAVDLHDADGVGAQARDADRLLHRGVGLRGDVDGGPVGVDALAQRRALAGPVQRGQQRDQVGTGAGVLDDAAAGPGRPEGRRQAEEVGEPVHDVLLELGGRRAGHPGHALDAETGRDEVAQHGRARGVGREVAEEPGVLPVRDAGQHDPVEVGQHGRERLALLGCRRRQRLAHVAGRHLRAHGQRADPAPVVGDPVDDLVAVLAELLGSHVRRRLGHPATVFGDPVGDSGGEGRLVAQHYVGSPSRGVGAPEGPRDERVRGFTPQGNGTWPRCGPPDEKLHSAPGATRTHTARVLNPLPLPIGVRGRAGVARRAPEQPSGEVGGRRRR